MGPLVLKEGGALAEGFPTLSTFIRFLSSVDSMVKDEVGTPAEGLSTLVALVGLVSSVHTLMLNEG